MPGKEAEAVPKLPRRGCAFSGCPRLAVEGSQYCEEHKKMVDSQYNRYERRPNTNRKYGRVWKRIRDKYAREHPLCERCLAEGRVTPVEEVHHIIPISQGGTHDPSNLMSLCQSCHTKIHLEMGDRQIRR
jgi:5-methylcytosine-specific restriction protein A